MSAPTRVRGIRCTACDTTFRSWSRWKAHECTARDDTDGPDREVAG
jgi:hypothetical protein